MRHAEAEQEPRGDDAQRPLSAEGRRDAATMARWIKENIALPNRLISSTALRARQTAALVARELALSDTMLHFERKMYNASVEMLEHLVEENLPQSECVLLIGHNPGMESLVLQLAGGENNPRKKTMTTSAIAHFTIDHTMTKFILQRCVRPEDLET